MDFAVLNIFNAPMSAIVMLGKGDGTFDLPVQIPLGAQGGMLSMIAADWNGDQRTDLGGVLSMGYGMPSNVELLISTPGAPPASYTVRPPLTLRQSFGPASRISSLLQCNERAPSPGHSLSACGLALQRHCRRYQR